MSSSWKPQYPHICSCFCNRVIKRLRTINTKLPLQFCMNGLTIMIGQLGLLWLANRKRRKKHVKNQLADNYWYLINIMSANSFIHMLSSSFSIGQLNKTYLTNPNCETVHPNWRGYLVLMVLYVFISLLLLPIPLKQPQI